MRVSKVKRVRRENLEKMRKKRAELRKNGNSLEDGQEHISNLKRDRDLYKKSFDKVAMDNNDLKIENEKLKRSVEFWRDQHHYQVKLCQKRKEENDAAKESNLRFFREKEVWKQRFELASNEKRALEQEKIIARNKKQLMIPEKDAEQLKSHIMWLREQMNSEKVAHNRTRLQLHELRMTRADHSEHDVPIVPERRLTPNEILMRMIEGLEVPVFDTTERLTTNRLMRKYTKVPKRISKASNMQNLKLAREKRLMNKELEKEKGPMNSTTPSSAPKDPAVSLPPRDPRPYMVRVPVKTRGVVERAPAPATAAPLETAPKGPLPPYNPRKRQLEAAAERQQQRVFDEQELRRKHSEEILVWKERFERSQAERKSLERRMYRQAQEFQERFDETVDNISWKERYAHLENFCRTCKGENINLKVELNGIKREMDKRDKEITELQLDLAYVRSLCTMPIPPRVKKPRKPRKPKLLPPPLSPSTINL
ncbi:hypothetical protein GCK72_012031 [Caenorhabditis remanei]|uniref:Uncharacterized protein n=1 Tax=Caenorhabditis remanei TaxID=31234 RepID=A0A6A5GLT5_CAERE|nr:hypothetical protein GCK72_012031 [Caenorhabditis remanei]KAF1755581.1 hypothetical protein GCK72_012031 [Caenorhabditis remanei]